MKKNILLLLLLCTVSEILLAQTFKKSNDDDEDPYEHKNYFMAGINYLNNNVYLGRKDTVVIPYFSPYIGYHFSNGIYGKAMVSYTSAGPEGNHIDLTTLEVGWDHNFGEHFNGGLNAERFIYNKNSISVRANTIGCLGMDAQYTNEILQPSFIIDVDFNKKTKDYVAGIALDHEFNLLKKKLKIIPIITINSGTQNYYDEYFTNRLTKKDKKIKVKHVVADATKFNVLDYEFSIKSTFIVNHWLFTLKPTYAIPVNPSIVALPNRTIQEKISNSFYLELDIYFRG